MKPPLFLRFDGLGDALLVNAVMHQYARENGGKVFVATRYPELFAGTPQVVTLPTTSQRLAHQLGKLMRLVGLVDSLVYLSYQPGGPDAKMQPLPGHILSILSAKAGVKTAPVRPVLFLRPEELRAAVLPAGDKPWIAMQSTGITTMTDNKNWFLDRFQAVARQLRQQFRIAQFGLASDPLIENDLDLRDRISPRRAAATLASCRALICQEGYLMHAATAVGTPAVVIFGGFISPAESGYDVNENLFTQLDCAPCWLRTPCPYDKECMKQISVANVLSALEKLLARHPVQNRA